MIAPSQPDRPLVCLVTPGWSVVDHARGPGTLQQANVRIHRVSALVAAAVEAGIDLVQIREGDLPARDLFELVRRAVARPRGRTRILVNDRLDVALAAGADGVHLGGRSLPPARVRQVAGDNFLIGCSVHHADEAKDIDALGVVDYLIAGTVFRSRSKPPDTPLLGPVGLAHVVAATTAPVLAIGGIEPDRIADVADTGAAGFAAIGLFADAGVSRLSTIVADARARFEGATRALPRKPR